MRQLKVEILRISSVLMDFFYRRSQDSTYTRTPHALRNDDSRLNLTIPKRGCLKIAFETASFTHLFRHFSYNAYEARKGNCVLA